MSLDSKNPFVCDTATSFEPDFIGKIFIEDHNYSRLLNSKRNFFIEGNRGSGKSMLLRSNSLPVQFYMQGDNIEYDYVGVYVPCNTPISHKREHEFFEEHQALAISEHYIVLSIAQCLVDTLKDHFKPAGMYDADGLLKEFQYITGFADFIKSDNVFESLSLFIQKESVCSQQFIKDNSDKELYDNCLTLFSFVVPLIRVIRKVPGLEHSHFSFLLDDAHDLQPLQKQVVNSYIAFRDHTLFSFKVGVGSVGDYSRLTAQGGTILEGHDYTLIDLEEDFQSKDSSFGKLARKIVERRLKLAGLANTDPDSFFPVHESFSKGLEEHAALIKREAVEKYGEEPKKVRDYVYKYARASYFRNRHAKAQLPIYSGFDTIAHISTGVVRNLLEPCFKMYDTALSKEGGCIESISPSTQSEVLQNMAQRLWGQIKEGYSTIITECTEEDSQAISNFFEKLSILFRDRLLDEDCSEPRVLVFTVSELKSPFIDDVKRMLSLARKAQVLFYRWGPSKDNGIRSVHYVPDRLLWITSGLDPNGQHGRLSIKSSEIYKVMKGGDFSKKTKNQVPDQIGFFDE